MSSYPIHRASHASPGRKAQGGFTLIELMITVLVGLVLLTLAVPSFDAAMVSGRINGQANELVATLQLARAEAIRRNVRVVVCPSVNGTSCAAATANWNGWVAFVDDGGYSHNWAAGVAANANNGTVDANETILRSGLVPSNVTVTTSSNISGNAGGAVIFNSDGLARTNAGLLLSGRIGVCVATVHPPENARNVMINSGGRIAVERAVNATCAAPGNASS
ncbi:MAG: GspH/FimT family pseudopilin [Proteobacteria bacterium]|nr:GspH/FimT family pseudopilin [Pseudomonadota bacterium]